MPTHKSMKYYKITCLEAEVTVVAKDEEEAAYVALEIANSQSYTLIDIEEVKISKKGYFPNKWQTVKDIDTEMFDDLPFDEFYEWRVCSHELLEGYHAIIRVKNKDTGKVKELVYKSRSAALNKIKALMKDKNVSFDVANANGVVGYP